MLAVADIAVVIIYLLFVLFIGFVHFKNKENQKAVNFLLGGRQLTLPAFIATLVTTWYGGILGIGEFTYRFGISNWLVFGVPYYAAALLFALKLAARVQKNKLYTIPHQLERAYGKGPSLLGALFVFIYTAPAAYILMLGVLLQFFFHWPLWVCIIIGAFFSLVYVYAGGFKAVVKTDYIQFFFMFTGFIIILLFCITKYGGIHFLKQSLPAEHFVWHGGNGAGYIIMWFFIALSTLVEPAFYQRCFAAKNSVIAKKGVIISVVFWLVFDLLTTFTGLYARAILPSLENPVSSFLELGVHVLPPVILGIFITGLLATIMSTVDSYSLIAAITIGRDYLWKIYDNRDESRIQFFTRIGLVITTIISIAIAVYGQSVVWIWKELGSISTPALLIPVVSSFSTKYKMRGKFVSVTILSGALFSLFWTVAKKVEFLNDYPLFQIESIYPGLAITIVIYLFDRLTKKAE